MGLFLADGSCDIYEYENCKKASWAINKADLDLLNEAKEKCPFETKILDTIESSGVYKLVPHRESFVDICKKYRPLFYNKKFINKYNSYEKLSHNSKQVYTLNWGIYIGIL
jgi:hypothetical protein